MAAAAAVAAVAVANLCHQLCFGGGSGGGGGRTAVAAVAAVGLPPECLSQRVQKTRRVAERLRF